MTNFYRALYDDLCVYDQDKIIKVTCAFPGKIHLTILTPFYLSFIFKGFIDTRKDLVELISKMRTMIPRVTPEEAADKIITAMLFDKREIFFPFFYRMAVFLE